METLTLTTKDHKQIAADFYPADGGRSAILVHMMPATKESWKTFAEALQQKGIASLAIDLRGHGASEDGPGGYKEFSDREHQAKIYDVEAAWEFLHQRGAEMQKTAVVGASIGANLSIVFGSQHHEIPAIVALSPGIDYRGVTTDQSIRAIGIQQHVLLVASEEDSGSFASIRTLADWQPRAEKIEKNGIGHGTHMTDVDPELFDYLVNWIDQHL